MRLRPLPQGGVVHRAGSGAGAPPRPPIRPLGGTINAWGVSACAMRGPGDHGEETKRIIAAMMLSRTCRDRASLSIVVRSERASGHHGVVWRVRPTGGPHLLLLLLLLCVCVCVCLCVWVYWSVVLGFPHKVCVCVCVWVCVCGAREGGQRG